MIRVCNPLSKKGKVMKKHILTILMVIGSYCAWISGCPTCVGHNHEESPPFFSEEFYKSDKDDSMDDLYEQFVQETSHAPAEKHIAKPSSDSANPGLPARQATPDKKEAS